MHPRDASRLGLSEGEHVEIRSRRGRLQATLQATATLLEGTVFVAMHDPGTNRLTFPDFDPYSRQPSYKHCAVSVSAGRGSP